MKSVLIKDIIESFCIIFLLPIFIIKLVPASFGLLLTIIFLMLVIPLYFIISPLRFSYQSKIIWLIPLINTLFFLLTVHIVFNNSALAYLWAYIPLSYLAIMVKIVYCNHKKKCQ